MILPFDDTWVFQKMALGTNSWSVSFQLYPEEHYDSGVVELYWPEGRPELIKLGWYPDDISVR